MRRKSERTASKKTTKASPEKKDKPEKVKRTKTRRRKQSTSSDNESADETKPVQPTAPENVAEENPPQTSAKENSPEETNEQVWQVKPAEGDVGEIQKLKICLTRPPSTPERADRSPRSKRKHSRSASGEPTDERKKTKHRSKRSTTESKEESEPDKNQDSLGDEPEPENENQEEKTSDEKASDEKASDETGSDEKASDEQTSDEKTSDEKTSDEKKTDGKKSDEKTSDEKTSNEKTSDEKKSDEKNSDEKASDEKASDEKTSDENTSDKALDENQSSQKQEASAQDTPMSTTTDAPKSSEETKSNEGGTATEESTSQEETQNNESRSESQEKTLDADTTVASPKSETDTQNSQNSLTEKEDSSRKRSVSVEKSEILEIHADESRCETSDIGINNSQADNITPDSPKLSIEGNSAAEKDASEVSITGDKTDSIISENIDSTGDDQGTINKPNVVENTKSPEKEIVTLITKEQTKQSEEPKDTNEKQSTSEPTVVNQDGTVHNGQAATHSNRKRRWGSRPSRITTQKSITISTDVLKDIIPDVKPVEFDEVIEDKRHNRRVEVTEKLERPVLPKIVIDNTESVEITKKENDDRDKENIIREINLSSNRKISLVKDSDSIIARPPSPPRHKQSNILFITNLVRPFTLPQLKNLLQRTGRIVDSGFWIDRIKSKCFVQYETEDQAVETRHALHGVTWPVSNPKTLHVDFSTRDDFEKAKANEETDSAQTSTIPGTVEDWLREQDLKRERGELEKPWERKMAMREWDVGKNEKGKEKDKLNRDERFQDKRRHRTPERSPEPAKKFKKKEEEAPAKLLDDLFRKTKATPCIYWLPLSAETIAIKEEQRRQHMAEHERRLQELRRTHRRH